METINYIYNGKSFKFIEDFEKEFKPTKWSIRKLIAFTNSFDPQTMSYEVQYFIEYTISVLKKYRQDKDTINFISQIENKRYTHFNFYEFKEKYKSKTQLKVAKESSMQIIKLMVFFEKAGIIEGSGTNIAKVLKYNFNINYSLSTIETTLYKFSTELNEDSSYSEIFKNFQKLSKELR